MAEDKILGKWKFVNGKPEFFPDRNLDRFTYEVLTRESAEKLGHIAWIEEGDPVTAIRKMVDAIHTAPINCAVWANANQGEAPEWRDEIARWRAANEAKFISNVFAGDNNSQNHFKGSYPNLNIALINLRCHFNEASDAPASVEVHMAKRLSDIFQAVSVDSCRFQFRAGSKDITSDFVSDHVDGNVSGRDMRFIEGIKSKGTYLFSNADSVIQPDPFDENRTNFVLPRQGNFTVYETPENGLCLFTNARHPWQPILHGEPFLPPDQPQQRRTVLVYDFVASPK